ncbi:MAG: hypothetical protein HY836_06815 [Aquabacterium sp.]|uniref:hypothetical protein n=1 Tax=Aquabacterium sp. TaxID=1872578 RepID=UPI0025B8208D|nr:hypothetical protein [Aquabacterium sp.]MBI5925295.1 hypothetical protein [Aquabacterium sp.]
MKKTDLVKHLGKKITGQMQKAAIPGRFAQGSTALPDRREQRKMDQAAGLLPFAVKLHIDLARQLREMAEREGVNLNALVDRLIRAGLGGAAAIPAAQPKVESKAVPAKKVVVKAEKAPAQQSAAVKKAPVKTAAVKKAVAVKAVEDKKKAPAKKTVATKAPAKKAAAKKATAQTVAKKAVKTKA